MSLTNDNMVLPVAPMYGGGNGGFGGDWGAWIVLFLIFGMFGNGGWGMNGGFGGGYDFPWLLQGQNNTNEVVSAGFNQAATQAALGDISTALTAGFGNVQTSLCGGFAGTTAAVTNAQNAITQQMYANQIADLNRSFDAQTANTAGLSNLSAQLSQCCCDNRLATAQTQNVISTEASATRQANSTNTQAILDKLCQLEMDGIKAQVEAKNDKILELQNQLNMATLRESQTAQNAFIAQGFSDEVDQLYNRLSNCPVPSTPVYGRTPIFTCSNQGGCGCNGGFYN